MVITVFAVLSVVGLVTVLGLPPSWVWAGFGVAVLGAMVADILLINHARRVLVTGADTDTVGV